MLAAPSRRALAPPKSPDDSLEARLKAFEPALQVNTEAERLFAAPVQFARSLLESQPPETFLAFLEEVERSEVDGLYSSTDAALHEFGEAPDVIRTVAVCAAWNTSDARSGPLGIALNLAAADLCELSASSVAALRKAAGQTVSEADDWVARFSEALLWFLDRQYQLTQDLLSGIDTFVAYRGLRMEAAASSRVNPLLRPLSSFSAAPAAAESFAAKSFLTRDASEQASGCLLVAAVPAERVLSSSLTGLSSFTEREVVVLGPKEGVIDDVWLLRGEDVSLGLVDFQGRGLMV